MSFNEDQCRKLKEAVIDAYPNQGILEMILSEGGMGSQLDAINRHDAYEIMVFNLIRNIKACDEVGQFISILLIRNPSNHLLQEVERDFRNCFLGRDFPKATTSDPLINSILLINYIPLDSPFYIERPPIENECYETILQPGALINIKAPRKMGKTSLAKRILNHAETHSHKTAYFDFRLASPNDLTNLGVFLKWFCANIARELGIADSDPQRNWNDSQGDKPSCTDYFERHILNNNLNQGITIAMDNVESIFESVTIAQEFFTLLRVWYGRSQNDKPWKYLKLIIVRRTDKYLDLDLNNSPFNVGKEIRLPALDLEQVRLLGGKYGLTKSNEEIESLEKKFGGHPYLTQIALHDLVTRNNENNLYQQHLDK
jgi:hypothetical protein